MIATAEEFVSLRNSENSADQHRAATDSADKSVWLEVIEKYPEYRMWVALNKSVREDVLRVLHVDEDSKVRLVVAMRRACPIDILKILAVDDDPGVSMAARKNPRFDGGPADPSP
jgi:hypothetical protein